MLAQQTELDAVRASITSLQDELGTELLSQLNPSDQREVWFTVYNILYYSYLGGASWRSHSESTRGAKRVSVIKNEGGCGYA